jgi:hypothetical protein
MGLLQAIFGGGHSTPQTPPPPGHQWGYDEQGNLVPVPVAPQAPAQAPQGAPSPLSAAPAPQAPQQAPAASPDATDGPATPVQVVGRVPQDNWHPHHAGILGQISDYILGTHFGRENERRNLAGALQTLETNPNLAIRRLMKVNPELAMRLEGQEADDKRQAGVAARQEDYDNYRKEQATYQLATQMLASAKDPATYATLRSQVQNLYGSRGIPLTRHSFLSSMMKRQFTVSPTRPLRMVRRHRSLRLDDTTVSLNSRAKSGLTRLADIILPTKVSGLLVLVFLDNRLLSQGVTSVSV